MAALAAANTNSTASSTGTITFNSPVTNPPLPGNPLLFAPGGCERACAVAWFTIPPAPPTADLPAPGIEPWRRRPAAAQ